MPIVPRLNRGPAQQQGLPNVRVQDNAPIEAFGGGQAVAGAFRAAGQLIETVQNEQRRIDDVKTTEAYGRLVKEKNRMFWDPESGAMTRRGKNAFGVIDEYLPKFDEVAAEIEKDLSSSQKALFQTMRDREKEEFNLQLQKHLYGETQRYDEEVTKATVLNLREDAVLNYQDPERLRKSIELQKSSLMRHFSDMGKDAEVAKAEVQKAVSETHRDVINRMLTNREDIKAKEYFESVKSELIEDDYKRAKASIDDDYTRGESQRLASEYMAKAKNDPQAALKLARTSIKDADIQKMTVDEIKVRHSENESFRRLREENLERQAANYAEANKDRPPANIWGELTIEARTRIDNRIKALKEGKDVSTDMGTYYQLKQLMSASATREVFKQKNLMEYADRIGKTELKELMDLQSKLRTGDEKVVQQLDGIQSKTQIVDDVIRSMGKKASDNDSTKDDEFVAQFRRAVDAEVEDVQNRSGKKVTNTEVHEIASRLAVEKVVSEGLVWDTKKRLFEVTISDVPSDKRKKIEASLKANGLEVTDRNVLHIFKAELERGKASGK